MNPVRRLRQRARMSQEALARAAGTSQPTIAAYEAGRKSPTVSTLMRLADAAGLEAAVDFVPALTREERRSLELHRAIAARLIDDPEPVLAQARRSIRRMASQTGARSPLLREWSLILRRPLDALLPVLTDPGVWARELRQLTPFAGALSAAERARVYRRFAMGEGGDP